MRGSVPANANRRHGGARSVSGEGLKAKSNRIHGIVNSRWKRSPKRHNNRGFVRPLLQTQYISTKMELEGKVGNSQPVEVLTYFYQEQMNHVTSNEHLAYLSNKANTPDLRHGQYTQHTDNIRFS